MGSLVSGRDCVLPQSSIVAKTFPPSGGFVSWSSCWGPPTSGWSCVLRPALVLVAFPPSSWIGPAPSRWVPLLGARCVWGLQPFSRHGGIASTSPVYSFGMRLWTKVYIWCWFLSNVATLFGSSCRIHTSSFESLELNMAGGCTLAFIVVVL